MKTRTNRRTRVKRTKRRYCKTKHCRYKRRRNLKGGWGGVGSSFSLGGKLYKKQIYGGWGESVALV